MATQDPAEKGIENEEKKTTLDQSRSAEKSTNFHENSGQKEENQHRIYLEMLKNLLIFIKTTANKKRECNESRRIFESRSANLPTCFYQNNNTSIKKVLTMKKNVQKGIDKEEEKKFTPDQSRSATDSHLNSSKENKGQKLRVFVSEAKSEVLKELMEHIKVVNENHIAQKNMESVRQCSEDKSALVENSCAEEKNSFNQLPNMHIENVENRISPNNMENIEYNNISGGELSTGQNSQTTYSEDEIRHLTDERENQTKNDNHSSVRKLKRETNIHNKTKPISEKDKIEGDKSEKWTERKPDNKNETKDKNFENKREIQNLLDINSQADELKVEGTFCNKDLMLQQKPFRIENNSQLSPESALNREDWEHQSSLFPSQPIIDTKSKEKPSLIWKCLKHNEYFFSEDKDDFPNEDYISVNENKELSLDFLPEDNIILSSDLSHCQLLFYPINVTEYLSSFSKFGNYHTNVTESLEIHKPSHELLLESSNMPTYSPFYLKDIDNNKSLETHVNKDLEDSRRVSRRVFLKAKRRNKGHNKFDNSHESKNVPSMQPNTENGLIKQVKNEVNEYLINSANKTPKPKFEQKQDELLHSQLNAFADVKITKNESESLLKQQNHVEKVEVNQAVVNFYNKEETMVNKGSDNNINQIPNLLISNTLETSIFPTFNNDSIPKKWDVSTNTDKKHEIQSFPKDNNTKSDLTQRKSEIRNFIRPPTFRYEDITNGYSRDIEITETKVNQQKYKTISEDKQTNNRQISKDSSIESLIDEVCSSFSQQSITDSNYFESKPQKTHAFQYAFINRKVIESPIVNDKGKEASTKNIKEFVSKLDEQLTEAAQPKNRRKAETEECASIPISLTAKNPDFTSDSPNFRKELFEPKQRTEIFSMNASTSSELRNTSEKALKITNRNYDSNAKKASTISKVKATNNGNELVKSMESLTLENQVPVSNNTNPFLRADTQQNKISEANNISSPNCSTYTTRGVATQISNEVSYITGDGKTHCRSGERLMVHQGNFVFQCALNEKSKCRLEFTSESNSIDSSDPELFKYNLVFERDAFKKGRY